jgi:hypothetical protein
MQVISAFSDPTCYLIFSQIKVGQMLDEISLGRFCLMSRAASKVTKQVHFRGECNRSVIRLLHNQFNFSHSYQLSWLTLLLVPS